MTCTSPCFRKLSLCRSSRNMHFRSYSTKHTPFTLSSLNNAFCCCNRNQTCDFDAKDQRVITTPYSRFAKRAEIDTTFDLLFKSICPTTSFHRVSIHDVFLFRISIGLIRSPISIFVRTWSSDRSHTCFKLLQDRFERVRPRLNLCFVVHAWFEHAS